MEDITTFEEHLDKQYGKKGTDKREQFGADSLAYRLGEMLKIARQELHMTQQELAEKTGTKKSYISRIECGKSDIQLSTFYKLIEVGLGRTLNISIR
ncbi:MAG: helix-turn-helix domain-containing protein [Candidatus Marinimicrobia bacterium]|nr:helix-turn-helix domain-containing protein [bacterium]MCG2715680.1 helix-turn-helix domain-containing protein [Candidatus Neomarinimicrobiota bacterium]